MIIVFYNQRDIIIDRFVIGKATRISPEAPIPVVLVEDQHSFPGGAGNVAANIKSLGEEPILLGFVGGINENLLYAVLDSSAIKKENLHNAQARMKLKANKKSEDIVFEEG